MKTIAWPLVALSGIVLAFVAFFSYSQRLQVGTNLILTQLRLHNLLPEGKGSSVISIDAPAPLDLNATLVFRVRRSDAAEDLVRLASLESFLANELGISGWNRFAAETTVMLRNSPAQLQQTYLYLVGLDQKKTASEGDRVDRLRDKLKELFREDSSMVLVFDHPRVSTSAK